MSIFNKSLKVKAAILMQLQDCGVSAIASLMSILCIRWLSDPIPGFKTMVIYWTLIGLFSTLIGTWLSGCHRVLAKWSTLRSYLLLARAVYVKEIIMIIMVLNNTIKFSNPSLYIVLILSDILLTSLFLCFIRLVIQFGHKEEIQRVRQEAVRGSALIAGTGIDSIDLACKIQEQNNFNVVGFLTHNPNLDGTLIKDILVYHCQEKADLKTLESRLGGISCIFFPNNGLDSLGYAGKECECEHENIQSSNNIQSVNDILKRTLDCVLSAVLIVVFFPLGLLSAIAIKIDDGGPIFYRQERIGRNGIPFYILKFRSMRTDAEKNGAQLYSGENDPRLTKVGAFLRKHHLDELPQLWNVFAGDMSFIGYRPERQVYITEIMKHNPRYAYLYKIRPGVTSYATLHNGYTDTIEKMLTRLDLDLYYLRKQSLLLDARILGLTFLSIVSGKRF